MSPGNQIKLVLVAHQAASVRDVFRIMLEAEGAEVMTTDCGEEALRMALERRADAVLLGLDLQNLDGCQARLLAESGEEGTLVLALTADARLETRERALASGFDRYLTLPILPPDLVRLLKAEIEY